jgi:preprotein translocase subunit SecG
VLVLVLVLVLLVLVLLVLVLLHVRSYRGVHEVDGQTAARRDAEQPLRVRLEQT